MKLDVLNKDGLVLYKRTDTYFLFGLLPVWRLITYYPNTCQPKACFS